MRRLTTAVILLAIAGLSACNTIEGAGKDMQSGGEKVERSADDSK